MKRFFFFLALLGSLQVAHSADFLSEWWQRHTAFSSWSELHLELAETIRSKVTPTQRDVLKPGGDWEKSFRLWQWLALMESTANDDAKPSLIALGSNADFLTAFFENLNPEDHPKQAVEFLGAMQKRYPEDVAVLPRLAVALALVFDQPFPRDWPHGQVARSALPIETPDPVLRLHSMAILQKDRRYLLDLRDLMVDELKYMVDYPLSESEME